MSVGPGACTMQHARCACGQKPRSKDSQPHGIDRAGLANAGPHRRAGQHAAHCEAAVHGQLTLIAIGPRRSSIRMSVGTFWAGGNCTGTKAVGTALFAALTSTPPPHRSASRTQRRARFGLRPWAIATAALDTPGALQAATTCALNSALCSRRRRRPPLTSSEIVCACPPRAELTPGSWTVGAYCGANDIRYSTGLSRCSFSLIRSWL